jgi:Holliday junction resolvase RusA-like endonuclease
MNDKMLKIPAMRYPQELGMTYLGSFEVPGRLVSKSNFKPDGRYYLGAKFKAFEDKIAWLAKTSLIPMGAKAGWVTIWPGSPNKRYIDLTNSFKSIMDGLVKAGIYSDDKDVAGCVMPMRIGQITCLEIWVATDN